MSCIQACMKAFLVEDTAKERGYQHFILSDSRCLLELKVDEPDLGLYRSHSRRRYGKRERLPALHLFRFALFVGAESR